LGEENDRQLFKQEWITRYSQRLREKGFPAKPSATDAGIHERNQAAMRSQVATKLGAATRNAPSVLPSNRSAWRAGVALPQREAPVSVALYDHRWCCRNVARL
jgi:hypothetical protein